jgi:sugar/nucleoside kinase (ribokinase family)
MSLKSKIDLVGVGLNATDTLIPLSAFPLCGSKTEYSTETVMPGGQTASAVVACQMWGVSTRYVGKLGDDDASRLHEHAFAAAGVEAKLVQVAGAASPRSLILVDGRFCSPTSCNARGSRTLGCCTLTAMTRRRRHRRPAGLVLQAWR